MDLYIADIGVYRVILIFILGDITTGISILYGYRSKPTFISTDIHIYHSKLVFISVNTKYILL